MTRLVVAGLGDTGLLTAVHLSRRFDVVGIASAPALVSGQELGLRLARPDDWARDYLIALDRFRGLDRARVVQGRVEAADRDPRRITVAGADGSLTDEPYDVLVIATGVTNGFWRRPELRTADQVDEALRTAHERLAAAGSVIVVGGGAAAVSSALNIATRWPRTTVDLYFPGERALPQHHPRVWARVQRLLRTQGVGLHPGHRAELPNGTAPERLTDDPVGFSTGQPEARADVVLWAVGQVRPNTAWLPADVLDERGFVRVGPDLQVPGRPGVFAIGDVAATDPLRSSARNRADKLLARNVAAWVCGGRLREYRPPRRRWGSVLGAQADGLVVFAPNGRGFRFPAWTIDTVLQPWIVRRGIYGGVRRG
ncbi:MAG: FAD-dependent oxidoreductase [Jatrophihabitans sp.]|uniref:FAD-dependent oxidoreductase n=1 Tax=Jatrophihabitans sp. TaxID=1932789 RepID=UPI003F7D1F83